ncbi:MAG TPA: glycosyltransferase, partial [Fimbriimonadaceae bacterium]|nr:glycosyltransferase [Fimbriimonadaceae bacterium]
MRIVIVNDHARIVGGAAKIAILSARALAERGHRVDFFAATGPVAPELAGLEVTCLGIEPHTENPSRLRGALQGIWYRPAARALRALLAQCDPRDTVVHFHAYRDALTASVADAAQRAGFVCVYTAHEYSMGCPYQGFFDYRRNEICHLRG